MAVWRAAAGLSRGHGSQAARVLQTREPILVEDFGAETRWSDTAVFREQGHRQRYERRVHGRDRPYGVLGVNTVGDAPSPPTT